MEPRQVQISDGAVQLDGELVLPEDGCQGIVLFAHGSGSSRHSPRNQAVARSLHATFGTLLICTRVTSVVINE